MLLGGCDTQQSDWSDFPKTALEFEAHFASEEACHAYLMRQRWPEGFRCAACGGTKAWPLAVDYSSARSALGRCP